MHFSTVTLILSVLALVADGLVALLVASMVAARLSPATAQRLQRPRGFLGEWGLALAWLVAVIATAGSLYFSESVHLIPCKLCWYQRIAMYPQTLILAIATLRSDAGARIYAGALAAAGAVISVYHYQLERFPSQPSACAVSRFEVPCSAIQYQRWGFLSIPYMALSAFALIVVLLVLARPHAADAAWDGAGDGAAGWG